MSSYRSYVPWKSNLPTTSYKAGSGSAYSSRDDVSTGNNTDNKSTARFGSITSPATYRPSYSGGTYRSAKSTRDSTTSSPSTYISRYATTKNEKEKPVESARKVQVTQSKYVGNTSNKENDNKISRFSTSTGNLTRYGQKSRDPSPAIDRRPQIAITRVRSREPSPVRSSLRARSRDPSPADVTLKTRIGTPTNGYTSPYRLCPRTSSNYTSRLANSNTSLPRSTLPEKALSYMSASDIRARPKTRIHNCTGSKAKQEIIEEVSSATTTSSLSTDSKEQKSSAKEISDDPEVFFPVMVVCRGTSPTPPGSASFVRARRTDLAKTIEKTIQRSSRKIQCVDKEIQSDRLDDSTRYCRHSAAGRLSSIPYSGYVENKFNSGSSRYSGSSGSAKTSRDSISKSENDNIDKKKIDDSTSSKNSSSRNSSKQEKSKSSSESKTKSTSSKQISNKQKSPDSLGSNSSRSLPPTIPKLDSPTKTITSVSSNKWPNKDFRKSALNVGPTDRPRKSRTPSTGTDSAEEQLPKYLINVNTRSSRSPSVGSEVSSASTTTISSSSENDQKRSHETKKITTSTTTSSVSHHQENTPLSIEKNVSYNKITGTNSSDGVSDEIHDVNINVGIREDKQQKLQQKINFPQNSLQTNSLNESSPVSKNAEAKSFLIQKLGSVSNFFATLTQDNSDETIHLDNSSSNSLSNESKQGGIIPIIGTVSQYLNSTATTATNHNNTINTSDNTYSKSETDIEDSSWWLNTSQQINTESALDVCDEMKYKLRHIDSGEIAWWNQNHEDDTIGDDLKTLNQDDQDHSENTDRSFYRSKHGSSSAGGGSAERSWWTLSENEVTSDKGSNNNNNTSENSAKYKIKQPDAEEPPPWWNHENSENNRNGVNQRAWWINENSKSPHELNDSFQDNNNKNHFKIQHADSGEAPWWMSNENSNESPKPQVEVTHNIRNQLKARYTIDSNEPPPWSNNDCTNNSSKNSPKNTSDHSQHSEDSATKGLQPAWWMVNNNSNKKLFKVRHIESGEKSWWLQDDPQETSQLSNHIEENESDVSDDDDDDDDDDDEVQHVIINNNYNKQNMYHDERLPLGDRASPEGLEDSSKGRKSPYDNIPSSKTRTLNKAQKLFISRHQNIDDILGGSCRPISPLMDRFSGKNSFMEEITPAQVRIHDSTAQMPIIQRVETDNNWNYSGSKLQPRELDDAALQVYKDGDYGAYLDLESSLAEQAEDIEGLNSSRKNSIVVRTQLSVRVHAIIEKLLSSEGSELRRALFSLKQIFQEDKDLVHGFVALGGLNCLVRVGNGADQNYQNYILRALGQVMLYVDGMNGVMKHGPTIQWLYSLIASKYRLVVKTALKLLLVFVEYTESNCYLLVNGIHAVDSAQGTLPWSNIMKLLKDYENADTELLIYATSLVNKTLSGLSDQDSFYDESDFLEQQGMEGVVQRYMSRPGTDLDLLDQLQLYEAVLKFEDGETDGIRIPDNSVRKTLRYRASTDTAERRKSRRHSTGTSPSIQQNNSTPKRYSPPSNGILDEDSSSSNNSNEFNSNGVFRDSKGQREGAGVTPGLRRRRERAERQKTFMREQQEASANGIRSPFDNKDELNGLGQIVTAIPIHLKNCNDSPPDSLLITNNNNNHKHNHNNKEHLMNNNGTTTSTTVPTSNDVNNLLYSPTTKSVLSNTTISVISNGFDKKNSNNFINEQQQQQHQLQQQHQQQSQQQQQNLKNTTEFVTNKNLVMRSNSNVITNGLMKNLNRNEKNNLQGINQETNDNNLYTSHKKFENDSNRLNNYYNQLSTTKNSNYTTSVLNQKNLNNNSDNTKFIGINNNNNNNNINNNGYTNGHSATPSRITGRQKDLLINSNNNNNSNNNSISNSISSSNGLNSNGQQQQQKTLTNPETVILTNGNTISNGTKKSTDPPESENENKKLLVQLKRDHTVKDLTQKLSNLPTSPQEDKSQTRIGGMTGLISKAKEGLAKSKSKGEISRSPSVDQEIKKSEPKKSENELHWEELCKSIIRPLILKDLDFTDLNLEDEKDVLAPRGLGGGIPPPPPPMAGLIPPPIMNMPPPPTNLVPPPVFNLNNKLNGEINNSTIKKNKKTVKLFWKEVREDMIPPSVGKTIWDELPKSNVDTEKLEHLFESRAKDLMTKKQQELNKNKEIIVLDHKRSNAINIAMTKLPPPRAIKAAILKMDATVVTREGIDKLLNMLPTDEERGKIQEAQMSNPELPLGSAEQFLLTLSSISELAARLKLWAFRLDFENSEKEIAEPLMDLKQGLELLKSSRTFKCILSTLLSVGIFLNGAPVKGFQIEYLAKVPEVKDTVHKHSLLHHLCHMVMESSPDTTDLYSEIGPITRASKADFTDLAHNVVQLETECKASWDRLKLIAKHDCPPQLKQKLVDFLADCAERIIILQIVHRRIINRYRKFLLWLGIPQHSVAESRPNEFCRIVSEFALEYRTTRERVQQQIEKKANHRERNKTRGKMIIDVGKFRTQEDRADAELKQLLGSPNPKVDHPDGTLTWRRRRAENLRSPIIKQNEENFTDGDDEILESLVKTATKASGSRPTPRERKRTRHADRKSLRRTLKNGLTEEEKQHVASLIKTY